MVTLEIIFVGVVALACGFGAAYICSKKTKFFDRFEKLEQKKKEFSKYPQKLIDILNKNGSIVDMGEDITYTLEDGKIVEKRTPHKVEKVTTKKMDTKKIVVTE